MFNIILWLVGILIIFAVATIILLTNPLLLVFLVFALCTYFLLHRRLARGNVVVVAGGREAERVERKADRRAEVKLVSVKADLGRLREVKRTLRILTPLSGYPAIFVAEGLTVRAVSGVTLSGDVSLDQVKTLLDRFGGYELRCDDKGVTVLIKREAGWTGRERAASEARELAGHVALSFNGRVLGAEELESVF